MTHSVYKNSTKIAIFDNRMLKKCQTSREHLGYIFLFGAIKLNLSKKGSNIGS